MSTGAHYTLATSRPCWYCVHWAGPCWNDPYMADCRRDAGRHCVADAAHGCAHWMRETGVDDDGWSPLPLRRPERPQRPQPAPHEPDAALLALARRLQRELDGRAAGRAS